MKRKILPEIEQDLRDYVPIEKTTIYKSHNENKPVVESSTDQTYKLMLEINNKMDRILKILEAVSRA